MSSTGQPHDDPRMNDSGDAERAGRRSRGKRLLEMDVADIATLPAIKRRSLHLLRLFTRAGRRFVEDRCIQRASALAYARIIHARIVMRLARAG